MTNTDSDGSDDTSQWLPPLGLPARLVEPGDRVAKSPADDDWWQVISTTWVPEIDRYRIVATSVARPEDTRERSYTPRWTFRVRKPVWRGHPQFAEQLHRLSPGDVASHFEWLTEQFSGRHLLAAALRAIAVVTPTAQPGHDPATHELWHEGYQRCAHDVVRIAHRVLTEPSSVLSRAPLSWATDDSARGGNAAADSYVLPMGATPGNCRAYYSLTEDAQGSTWVLELIQIYDKRSHFQDLGRFLSEAAAREYAETWEDRHGRRQPPTEPDHLPGT